MFNFSFQQSTAIFALQFQDNQVNVTYQSNPDRSYAFSANQSVIQQLQERAQQVISGVSEYSLGKMINDFIKTGEMVQVAV